MTKKHVNKKAAVPVRTRSADNKAESDMYIHDHVTPGSSTDVPPLSYDATHMHQFGPEMNAQYFPTTYNIILPSTTPTLQFPAPEETPEDEQAQAHLFYSYILAELNAEGVQFDANENPFMNDLIVDESVQPSMPAPYVATSHVPVYPRRQTTAFTSPPPQPWPIDAFRITQLPTRPAPVQRSRPLLPKGSRMPPAAPVETIDAGDPNPGRGRKRALSPDARAAAREVRLMGACARCAKKRERCGTVRPCNPCKGKNKRSLDIPCMRELPEDTWGHLFTEQMYGHLEFNAIKEAIPDIDQSKRPFVIRLHQYFDNPELKILVAPFIPETRNDVHKSIFPIGRNPAGYEVQQTEIISPPLVPVFNDKISYASFTNGFYLTLRRWLDLAEVQDDIEWNFVFFREAYGKAWPRAIFGDVCEFYHHVTKSGCPVLKSCLQTTVLVYMIGHSFYIPDEDVEDVFEKTFDPPIRVEPTEWVSPIHVDRFLKTLLLPVYKAGVKASLRGLQNLYSPAKPSAFIRDRLLAASITLLIIAASQQGKAIEKALARQRQGKEVDTDAVFYQIREIEEHLIDMIIQLWEYKFPAGVKMGVDEPKDRFSANSAKAFKLLERFRCSFEESSDNATLKDLPTNLPQNIDSKKFGADNIERVLKKFYVVVFPEAR